MRGSIISAAMLLLAVVSPAEAKTLGIYYVDSVKVTPNLVVIDTRAQSQCMRRSLAGAHCLPATDLLGQHGELPNFADIYWALGTAGLDGSETVLVVGNHRDAQNFVAGVLYLCGQSRVEILRTRITQVLRTGKLRMGPGVLRAILRQRIYRADMRDATILLPAELPHLRKQNPQFSLINADKLRQGVLIKLAKTKYANRRHQHTYVVYAASARKAIIWFTRILASGDNMNSRIQVIPMAMPIHGQT